METMVVTPRTGKSFAKGVAAAKALHARFDGASKTWQVRVDFIDAVKMAMETREEYLRRNHLVPAGGASVATRYRGQASLDHEDSIF